jgi:hypothetical protein
MYIKLHTNVMKKKIIATVELQNAHYEKFKKNNPC